MKAAHQSWDPALASRLIAEKAGLEGPLLPILHELMGAFGCIPAGATPLIAEALNLSRAEVHGIISFYHDFRDDPAGRVSVKICRAEACQAMGGPALAEALLERLGLDWGQTTPDSSVTIEPVYCLGLCATAPAALINDQPAGRLSTEKLANLIDAAR